MFSPDFTPDNVVSMPNRLPPQAIEAEEVVLGGILFDPEALARVIKILQPQDFYVGSHKNIYQAAVRLHQSQQPTDLLFVTSWLESHGLLHNVGGRNKLASLLNSCVSSVNIDALAELIREKAQLRAVIQTALSRKAEGRRQEAEGNSDFCQEARDHREQGFKTPPSIRR
jgi:replicative DNA helicase